MAITYYCLSMILSESKLYSSIRILSDESISTSSSSSYDVLLPYSLDASHLAEFCSHINPLACLSMIDSLSDKFDYSHAAQEAVNRMNALLLQQNISFGTSKCGHDHTLVDDESLRDSCLTDPSNVNLTAGQKELLLWHWKLGIGMA